MRENQKNQDSTCELPLVFHMFTKSRRLSYGRYAHSGIRVRPKTRKTKPFREKASLSLSQKLQPKTKNIYIYKTKKQDI